MVKVRAANSHCACDYSHRKLIKSGGGTTREEARAHAGSGPSRDSMECLSSANDENLHVAVADRHRHILLLSCWAQMLTQTPIMLCFPTYYAQH